ncbi:MAG: glycosyltransferase family 1 protein [Spirosomataceae bacterium]|jgi:glycosyltransferase involved in cell wall biosynthesis
MRIGIEAQRIFRSHKHGMDVVALELVKAIQNIDTKNQYYIFIKKDEDNSCLKSTPNVKVIETSSYPYIIWEQIILPIYAWYYKIDLLHCTSNTAPFFCPCPIILTLHDVIFLEKRKGKNTMSSYQKFGNLYRKWLVPAIIRRTAKVITISHQERENILGLTNLENQKLEVIHNGVSKNFGHKIPETLAFEMSEKFLLGDEFALFLGNVEPRKNTPNLLKAFVAYAQNHPDFQLVITGVNRKFVADQMQPNSSNILKRQIITPGFVSQDELTFLYSYAKVFLFPSLREGFGLPILEAMSQGTPVITSNTSSMPEVAGDAAILIDPNDPRQITAAMEKLIKNHTLRQELSTKGKERIGHFSWENTAKKYLEQYYSILSLKPHEEVILQSA